MIPEEKNAAVARALQETFGVTEFAHIRRMTKGLSSDLVFRIVVRGTPYLLRIMTRIDERMDPDRIFACMSAAARAGLAPCVRYSNAEDGISITDFVEAVPFPATQALVQLPGTLRRLHALPPFPKAFNYVTAHNGFIWRFRKASLLPQCEIEEVFTRYEQVCATYPRLDSDVVSWLPTTRTNSLILIDILAIGRTTTNARDSSLCVRWYTCSTLRFSCCWVQRASR